jgi:hypothetical protein
VIDSDPPFTASLICGRDLAITIRCAQRTIRRHRALIDNTWRRHGPSEVRLTGGVGYTDVIPER